MNTRQASVPSISPASRLVLPVYGTRVILILASLLAALPAAPAFSRTPGLESGAALSLGAEILRGRVLYRDLWSSQPPLLAYLDALGLAPGGPERWGVWALELVALVAAAFLLFALLRRSFGQIPALLAVMGLLANLTFVSSGGNLPELYALPLQTAILLLLADTLVLARPGWRPLTMGLLLGLCAALDVSLAAMGLVALLFLLSAGWAGREPRFLASSLGVAAGALLVGLGWSLFFATRQAFGAFSVQVLSGSVFYSTATHFDRITALRQILAALYKESGFFTLGAIGWLALPFFLYFRESRFRAVVSSRQAGILILGVGLLLLFNGFWNDSTRQWFALSALSRYRYGLIASGLITVLLSILFFSGRMIAFSHALLRRFSSLEFCQLDAAPGLFLLLIFALVDLPLQLALSALAGSAQGHLFLPVLLPLAVLIAFLAWSMLPGARVTQPETRVWLVVLALPVLFSGIIATGSGLQVREETGIQPAIAWIDASTAPGTPILQWGMNSRLYFLADRPAASRYLDPVPLFAGPAADRQIDQFLADVQANPPQVVIDTRAEDLPLVTTRQEDCARLNSSAFVEQILREQRDRRYPLLKGEPVAVAPVRMTAVYRWLCDHYQPVETLEADPDAWRLYRLRNGQP